MYEPVTTSRVKERVKRRVSTALSKLRSRFYARGSKHPLFVDNSGARELLAGRIWRSSWTWLLQTLPGLTRFARKPMSDAHLPFNGEEESAPTGSVSLPPDAQIVARHAPRSHQVCPPTVQPIPSPIVPLPLPFAAQPQTPPVAAHPQTPPEALRLLSPPQHREDHVLSTGLAPNPTAGEAEPPATIRAPAIVIPIAPRQDAKLPVLRRVVAIADCENDTVSVQASLRFVGLLNKQGKLKTKSRGACIVQTGDFLHKNAPNPSVVGYWEGLRTAVDAAGCALHLVAGNHELEIWRRLKSGARLGLKRCDQQATQDLIRTTKLFHVEGSMLFIHGYPTINLLRHIEAYKIATGKGLNDYNQDCFQAAFDDPKLLARYAYPRTNVRKDSLLYDVAAPARYYRRHGQEVAELLNSLGIDLVVHGHRPERSGLQADNELQQWLPGIRMISSDIQLRVQGLGATVIKQVESGSRDLLFVNKDNTTSAHRSEVRRLLRAPNRPASDHSDLKKAIQDGPISNFVRDKSSRTSTLVAARRATTA